MPAEPPRRKRTPLVLRQASADDLAQVPTPAEQREGQREQQEIGRELAEAEAASSLIDPAGGRSAVGLGRESIVRQSV
jgi:hypothetical protein